MADPLWINADTGAPVYSANELRQAMALAVMYDGRNVGGREGVRPGGTQLAVSLVGSDITVQPGLALIDSALSTPQGPYWVAIGTAASHTLTAADVTNPRKDIVILRVYDDDEDTSGQRTAVTEYLVGTPAGTPVEPTVPDGAMRLATIDVPASGGGSPVVTDRRPFTVAAGGILPVADQTARDALSPWAGLTVYRLDTFSEETYNGTVWVEAGYRLLTRVVLTSSGSFTKATYPGLRAVEIECQGAGGGSGGAAATLTGEASASGAGAGGTYARKWVAASALAASETVTVGAGGTAGAAGDNPGGQGGNSSVGTLCVATGGLGGDGSAGSNATTGSAGGASSVTGAVGDLIIRGSDGGDGRRSAGVRTNDAVGGSSHLGGTRSESNITAAATGNTGYPYGGGASGAHAQGDGQAAQAGAVGGAGIVIVNVYV